MTSLGVVGIATLDETWLRRDRQAEPQRPRSAFAIGAAAARVDERPRRGDAGREQRSRTLAAIDFFVHSRAAPGAADVEHDPALDEEHWSYTDGFAAGMTARGPTLLADRTTWTGSVHIVDLPSAEVDQQLDVQVHDWEFGGRR